MQVFWSIAKPYFMPPPASVRRAGAHPGLRAARAVVRYGTRRRRRRRALPPRSRRRGPARSASRCRRRRWAPRRPRRGVRGPAGCPSGVARCRAPRPTHAGAGSRAAMVSSTGTSRVRTAATAASGLPGNPTTTVPSASRASSIGCPGRQRTPGTSRSAPSPASTDRRWSARPRDVEPVTTTTSGSVGAGQCAPHRVGVVTAAGGGDQRTGGLEGRHQQRGERVPDPARAGRRPTTTARRR